MSRRTTKQRRAAVRRRRWAHHWAYMHLWQQMPMSVVSVSSWLQWSPTAGTIQ